MFDQAGANECAAAGVDQVGNPNPALMAMFTLEVHERLAMLDDNVLRKIAILWLEGYTKREIA